MKSKFKFLALFSLVTFVFGPLVAISVLEGDIMMTVGMGVTYLLFSAILYATYMGKRKKQYPLALLDVDDIYFPRTNIPRPIHEDIRRYPKYFGKKEEEQTQYRPEQTQKRHRGEDRP